MKFNLNFDQIYEQIETQLQYLYEKDVTGRFFYEIRIVDITKKKSLFTTFFHGEIDMFTNYPIKQNKFDYILFSIILAFVLIILSCVIYHCSKKRHNTQVISLNNQ